MVRDHLKLEVVRLYYLENLSQNQIAKQMEISRSYVSKLLIEARKEKLIEIRSSNPWLIETEEEKYLRKKYGLKKAFMVSAGRKKDEGKREAYYQELGRVLNDILNAIVKDGDTIGVAWGRTIYECSKRLSTDQEYKGIKVVQLCGGLSQNQNSTFSGEISNNFVSAFGGDAYAMTAPAIVENKAYKEIFLKEHGISQVMQLWENMNIAVFTVGKCEQQSSLVRSGYIPDHMIEYLKDTGAVGEVCTHFIDKDGRCANQDLEDRTIAVPMEQLKNCEFRIAVILGEKRLETLRAVLKAGYANVLIIDEEAAEKLIQE